MGFQVNIASFSSRTDRDAVNAHLDDTQPDILFLKRGVDLNNQAYSTTNYADSIAMLAFKSDKYEVVQSNSDAIVLKEKGALKTIKIIRDHEDDQLSKVLHAQGQSKGILQRIKELFFGRSEQDADLIVYCLAKEAVTHDSLKYRIKVLKENEFTTASNMPLSIVDGLFYKARIGEEAKIEIKSASNFRPVEVKFTVKDSDSIPWKIRQWIKNLFG